MRAKELATLAGTTVRTIRYYHQLGLLAVPEEGTTWRSYGFTHLTRLMRIRWLVDSGVPLAEVPHLLRRPHDSDERAVVTEDLEAVFDSIEAKIAVLTDQRERVRTLLRRVETEGRLSPLPASIERMYAALLARPLPAAVLDMVRRERELLELACYRGALPEDVVLLVDSLDEERVDALCALFVDMLTVAGPEGPRDPGLARRVEDLVRRTVEIAYQAEPGAAGRLLARAAELDRPVVRGAFELAYPSPVIRQLVTELVAAARERGVA